MSVFNQNSPQENSEELLYQAIKDELKPVLEAWDKKSGALNGTDIVFQDSNRTKLIKDTSKIVMQFIWRKLGMKIPDYTRQLLDKDFNLLELKQKD